MTYQQQAQNVRTSNVIELFSNDGVYVFGHILSRKNIVYYVYDIDGFEYGQFDNAPQALSLADEVSQVNHNERQFYYM